jgi:hypothetical protein
MYETRRAALHVLGLLFLLTCTSVPAESVVLSGVASIEASPSVATLSTMQSPSLESAPATVVDPYAGYASWCEPLWYETPCQEHAECRDIAHVARRPLRCIRPWWAKKDDLRDDDGNPLKICAPGYTAKTERRWRRARLRELVAQAYFDEPTACPDWSWKVLGAEGKPKRFQRVWANGRPTHQQHWRCTQEWRKAETLADFLWVPYFRETTARPWKRHRLPADTAANRLAWVKEARDYGWIVELQCEDGRPLTQGPDGAWRDAKGRRCRKGRDRKGGYTRDRHVIADYYPDPAAEQHNPYYGERYRWQYGNGGLGKNTAYGTQDWDKMAPPEILCHEVAGFEAYLRDARHAVRTFRGGGVDCGDETRYRGLAVRVLIDPVTKQPHGEREVEEPSWADVHRVASGGKFCPQNGVKAAEYARKYARRMESVGLRVDSPVTEEMFGSPIARDEQNERAAEILARIEAVLPPAWPVPGASQVSDVSMDKSTASP